MGNGGEVPRNEIKNDKMEAAVRARARGGEGGELQWTELTQSINYDPMFVRQCNGLA